MSRVIKKSVENALRSIDPYISELLRLKLPTYTQDPNLVSGDGIYEAEEWSLTRTKGAELYGTDGSQYDNDYNYCKYIFRIKNMKVLAAVSLANHFDFSKYSRVFEIGCGDMLQALVIKNMFSGLQYLATDFDPYVIEKLSNLPMLRDVQKAVFDATNSNLSAFQDYDLLISWGLDYALEDQYLLNVLCSCKKFNTPFLMCTPTIAGLTHLISHAIHNRKLKKTEKIRMHGWSRSLRTFRYLARKSRMNVKKIGKHGNYCCLLFSP